MSIVVISDSPSIGQPPFSSPRDEDLSDSRGCWCSICHYEREPRAHLVTSDQAQTLLGYSQLEVRPNDDSHSITWVQVLG